MIKSSKVNENMTSQYIWFKFPRNMNLESNGEIVSSPVLYSKHKTNSRVLLTTAVSTVVIYEQPFKFCKTEFPWINIINSKYIYFVVHLVFNIYVCLCSFHYIRTVHIRNLKLDLYLH